MIEIIIILALFCLWLLLQLQIEKSRRTKPEVQYINTTGISTNPPEFFIETWQGRTLNIKVNEKHNLIIPQLPAPRSIDYIDRIAKEYAIINGAMVAGFVGIVGLQRQAIMHFAYKRLINHIYNLSKPFAKVGYKKALFNKAKNDMIWTLDVTEQINDYWQLIKKKVLLQTMGRTLKQTDGYYTTWTDYKLDVTGARLIQPRYELR
jgi:hypothetical protein